MHAPLYKGPEAIPDLHAYTRFERDQDHVKEESMEAA